MTVHRFHAMATSTDRECRTYGVFYFLFFVVGFQIHFQVFVPTANWAHDGIPLMDHGL